MSSAVRLVVTTGIAWILSLTVAVAVILGVHRALSPIEARQAKASDRSAAPELVVRVADDRAPEHRPGR